MEQEEFLCVLRQKNLQCDKIAKLLYLQPDTFQLKVFMLIVSYSHCLKLETVLNENDTPQNEEFLLVYTLVLPKESRLQKSVGV